MRVLFIFLDGVGLGADNPAVNPLVRAQMPHWQALLGGHKIARDGYLPASELDHRLVEADRATLLAVDARLGIPGIPQSATGQATIITGTNVAQQLGSHEGPKPTPPIIEILSKDTLFTRLQAQGKTATLVNAYPPRYFTSIEGGHHLPGVFAMAVTKAGIRLKTKDDLFNGQAISVDFTGDGWRSHLGYEQAPLLSPVEAGTRLWQLSEKADLAIFEYWLSDVAGHHRDMLAADSLLSMLDSVFGSLLDHWKDEEGLILVTSDHGNLEDLSTRRHTLNDVPLLIIGSHHLREKFIQQLNNNRGTRSKFDLTDICPAILNFIA